MAVKVLVAYGTKYGATAEIAEKIGEVLRKQGLEADITPAKRAGSPVEYAAAVIGSAVYIGGWRKEVSGYLKANESLLASRPVWIFSSGPTGEGDAVELMSGWTVPKGLKPVIDRIKPRDIAVFHGLVDLSRLKSLDKWMINRVKSPIGDFRNWEAIGAWAEGIATTLKKT
jgi:menaquinone-dependent protoporphyrinogen oxidase